MIMEEPRLVETRSKKQGKVQRQKQGKVQSKKQGKVQSKKQGKVQRQKQVESNLSAQLICTIRNKERIAEAPLQWEKTLHQIFPEDRGS